MQFNDIQWYIHDYMSVHYFMVTMWNGEVHLTWCTKTKGLIIAQSYPYISLPRALSTKSDNWEEILTRSWSVIENLTSLNKICFQVIKWCGVHSMMGIHLFVGKPCQYSLLVWWHLLTISDILKHKQVCSDDPVCSNIPSFPATPLSVCMCVHAYVSVCLSVCIPMLIVFIC